MRFVINRPLRGQFALVVGLVTVTIACLLAASIGAVGFAQEQFRVVVESRVRPLQHLRSVSDAYRIDIVDSGHDRFPEGSR